MFDFLGDVFGGVGDALFGWIGDDRERSTQNKQLDKTHRQSLAEMAQSNDYARAQMRLAAGLEQKNFEAQWEQLKKAHRWDMGNTVRMRVEDARRAGVHPMFALGAAGASPVPTVAAGGPSPVGVTSGGGGSAPFQGGRGGRSRFGDAMQKMVQRQDAREVIDLELAREQLRRAKKETDWVEEQIAASQAARNRQAQNVSQSEVGGFDRAVKVVGDELVSRHEGKRISRAGKISPETPAEVVGDEFSDLPENAYGVNRALNLVLKAIGDDTRNRFKHQLWGAQVEKGMVPTLRFDKKLGKWVMDYKQVKKLLKGKTK